MPWLPAVAVDDIECSGSRPEMVVFGSIEA